MKVVGEAHASCVHTVPSFRFEPEGGGGSRRNGRFAMRELGSLHYRTVSNWRVPHDGLFG